MAKFFYLTYGLKAFSVIDVNCIEMDIDRLFNKSDISVKSRGITRYSRASSELAYNLDQSELTLEKLRITNRKLRHEICKFYEIKNLLL